MNSCTNIKTMEIEQIKVALIGEARAGKSSILTRYVTNTWQNFSTPTLGAAFQTRQIEIGNRLVQLNIWDTAGQERYHSIARLYSRDAKIIIFVYDITDRTSFEGMKK